MLYPVLTQSRLLSDLSGVWNFKLDNGKGFEEKWYEKPLKDADTMPVPASYNDLKEGTDFRDHYGWVFYQRNISVPEYVKSQRIVLRCAAVTHYAMIYLNGKLICEHKGGFLPFEVELNDHLQDGDNLLTIAVNNVIDYTTLPVGGKANMMSGLIKSQDVIQIILLKLFQMEQAVTLNFIILTEPLLLQQDVSMNFYIKVT